MPHSPCVAFACVFECFTGRGTGDVTRKTDVCYQQLGQRLPLVTFELENRGCVVCMGLSQHVFYVY